MACQGLTNDTACRELGTMHASNHVRTNELPYVHTITVILGPVDDEVDVVAASDLNGPIPSLFQKLNPPQRPKAGNVNDI